jgi:hypothetical protein
MTATADPRLGRIPALRSLMGMIAICWLGFLGGCKREDVPPSPEGRSIHRYLHISHIRTGDNGPILPSIAAIDFTGYDMRLLGGDMAYSTSEDDTVMDRLQASFQLGSPNTLWALGNHDYTDLDRIHRYTARPRYYSYSRDGITFIVLDTQDSLCQIQGAQLALFDSVLDTLERSTHLILLHHKLMWMPDNPTLEPLIPAISNIGIGPGFNSLQRNNFYARLYPRLVEAHARGIEVLCVGGDMGNNAKEFAYETPEGIHFLGSGLSYLASNQENRVLLFSHDLLTGRLDWKFLPVSELMAQ